jgi:hypothetical protein
MPPSKINTPFALHSVRNVKSRFHCEIESRMPSIDTCSEVLVPANPNPPRRLRSSLTRLMKQACRPPQEWQLRASVTRALMQWGEPIELIGELLQYSDIIVRGCAKWFNPAAASATTTCRQR